MVDQPVRGKPALAVAVALSAPADAGAAHAQSMTADIAAFYASTPSN